MSIKIRRGTSFSTFLNRVVAPASALLLGGTAFAQAPNDDCSNPSDITAGIHAFDFSQASTSFLTHPCQDGMMHQDLWYCFEAPVTGVVTISTCNLTLANTRIILWGECGCPDPDISSPVCCGDDECGKQTRITCEVVCGRKYMIQLASADQGDLSVGQFSLAFDGEPCGGGDDTSYPPAGDCTSCGEGDPGWLEDAGFAGGQMMLFTRDSFSATELPLVAFDLTNDDAVPVGTNWAAPQWSHPDWTRTNLGTIFGVAMDDQGRGFVAHSSVFSSGTSRDLVGALGAAGSIYQIDAATGAPSVFATLPQTQDPAIAPATEAWPGIGNIAWDFDHGQLFASNFDDGRIYRIDGAGNVIDAWDHATDTLSLGGAAEAGDADGFAPLGERVWAVCPTVDRLYYSVWGEDIGRGGLGTSNQIWSVALNGFGSIVPGTRNLEFELPDYSNDASMPVSDIAIDDQCCMLLAERSMANDTGTAAHQSRGLRYCHDGAAWAQDLTYQVGTYGTGANASGGVDFDNGGLARSWFSADAINLSGGQAVYGSIGIPVAGDLATNSVWIDADQNVAMQEKLRMGSLEVSCYRELSDGPCLDVVGTLECLVEDGQISQNYALEFEITNNSTEAAQYLLITGPVSSNVVPLVPELLPGQTTTVDLTVTGPIVDETVCFSLTLYDENFDECCGLDGQDICLVVPECDCAVDQAWEVVCIDEAAGIYEFSFELVNLTSDVVEHVFLVSSPGSPFTFSPDHVAVPPTPQFGTMSVGPIQVTTSLVPGDDIDFVATLHVANLAECCGEPVSFTLPECGSGSTGNPYDLNGDGIVDGADMGIIFGNWGGSGIGDIDGDGVVGASDLGLLLGNFGLVV